MLTALLTFETNRWTPVPSCSFLLGYLLRSEPGNSNHKWLQHTKCLFRAHAHVNCAKNSVYSECCKMGMSHPWPKRYFLMSLANFATLEMAAGGNNKLDACFAYSSTLWPLWCEIASVAHICCFFSNCLSELSSPANVSLDAICAEPLLHCCMLRHEKKRKRPLPLMLFGHTHSDISQ